MHFPRPFNRTCTNTSVNSVQMFPIFSLLEKKNRNRNRNLEYLAADMKEKIFFFALLCIACAHIDPLPWQYPPDYCMYCKRIMKLIDNLATGTLPFTIDRLKNATGNLCSLIEDPTLLNFRATVSSFHISSLIQGCWKFGYRDMAVESNQSFNQQSEKGYVGV